MVPNMIRMKSPLCELANAVLSCKSAHANHGPETFADAELGISVENKDSAYGKIVFEFGHNEIRSGRFLQVPKRMQRMLLVDAD